MDFIHGVYGILQIDLGCGEILVAEENAKFFISPNYPNDYNANDDCTWNIRSLNNEVVTIVFEAFNVRYHMWCDICNHLKILQFYIDAGGKTQQLPL